MTNSNSPKSTTRQIKMIFTYILLLVFLQGWGNNGHKLINRKSTDTFPTGMNFLQNWADSLAAHASDADYRKGSDPSESPKHFIDIDNYPEFVSSGRISLDIDSLIAVHGYSFVIDQGILPWTICTTVDSLTAAFKRNDLQKAMLFAADLGHYVGDGHMPLHITRNYNGQYTGQSGVHSRYESNMINRYLSSLIYTSDSAMYIAEVKAFTFSFLYENYKYVDSVLYADAQAKAISGSTSSDQYHQKLWQYSGVFTLRLFKNASDRLGSLIYTAWVNAQESPASNKDINLSPKEFIISGPYPNPFNGATSLHIKPNKSGTLQLSLISSTGEEIYNSLLDFPDGSARRVILNLSEYSLPSGIYYARIKGIKLNHTLKLVYLK